MVIQIFWFESFHWSSWQQLNDLFTGRIDLVVEFNSLIQWACHRSLQQS